MKKIRILLFVLIALLPSIVRAEKETITLSVFTRAECVHCEEEKEFLDSLEKEIPYLEVFYYDLSDEKNYELFQKITEKYTFPKATPITLLHGRIFQGFDGSDRAENLIRDMIENNRCTNDRMRFEDALSSDAEVYSPLCVIENVCDASEEVCQIDTGTYVRVPVLKKEIDVGGFSLSTLSIVLGFIDGFNPCAMWVLVMFLIILSQVGSRKKMFQYAGLFIFAEAFMYYLILNVWFYTIDFVGLSRIVTPGVGLLAVGSGIYFLYKFATYKPVCPVASSEQQRSISEKIKDYASKPLTWAIVAGILSIAFSVNIFEFACSIGIPQTYAKILEMNSLHTIAQQFYIFLYILSYMADDFFVFGLAILSIDRINDTQKYSKWSSLIGGMLMITLGLIMLFKPALLIF